VPSRTASVPAWRAVPMNNYVIWFMGVRGSGSEFDCRGASEMKVPTSTHIGQGIHAHSYLGLGPLALLGFLGAFRWDLRRRACIRSDPIQPFAIDCRTGRRRCTSL
jgi:hypothetical protein